MAKLDRFDHLIPAQPFVNPWRSDGTFEVDTSTLRALLSAAVGTSQASGTVAAAVDVWAAEELRRAGFDPDEVWPRRTAPRVLPRDVRNFVKQGLTKSLRTEVESRYSSSGARNALPAEANVMGSAYSKQADVVVASWAAGIELLISTKTMLSSYQKNLRNRFEEGYGDAKNLRGRHPLAALGFVFVVGNDIPAVSLEFAIDMLRKLTTEPDVYDCACLIVVEGAAGTIEEAAEDGRGIEEEPTALLNLPETDEDGTAEPEVASEPVSLSEVELHFGATPPDLAAGRFFETLVGAALERMPVAIYPEVRHRRLMAREGEA